MSFFSSARGNASETLDHSRKAVGSARDAFVAGRKALPDLAHEAQRRVSEHAEALRDRGGEVADQASERFDEARTYVVDHVQERPITATLAAVGVGFVLGLLFTGRR